MPDHVEDGDEEVLQDEAVDEFADYFGTGAGGKKAAVAKVGGEAKEGGEGKEEEEEEVPKAPHIMITTSMHRQRGGKVRIAIVALALLVSCFLLCYFG
jgi:hypothetical protein